MLLVASHEAGILCHSLRYEKNDFLPHGNDGWGCTEPGPTPGIVGGCKITNYSGNDKEKWGKNV